MSTEQKLRAAAVTGALIDLRAGDAELDDPAQGMNWGAERQVRAELLVDLLTQTQRPDGKFPRAIKMRGARITGFLNLEAAALTCPLLLQYCRIDEQVNLNEATAPAIRMPGCHIPALDATQLRTIGDLVLNGAFINGEIGLIGAHIGGQLSLNGARLLNRSGLAMNADGLTVDQGMFCRDGFTARGEVSLIGAHIGGSLDLNGANLGSALDYPALSADRLTVDQAMFCRDGFTARGEVRLLGAHIGGPLDLAGAILDNASFGLALYADRLTVDESMFCRSGFTAHGGISMIGAHIGGQLSLTGAELVYPGRIALNLQDANVSAIFLQLRRPPHGWVDLANARVGSFHDDPASWPAILFLGGFAYDSLENENVSARDRLRWLALHRGGYTPQLYDQLAATYQRAGDEQATRKIAIAKQWRRRRKFNPLSLLWYATVGYGYRTWLAGAWLAVLVAVGTSVFSHAYPAHMIALRARPPAFHPVAYTVDLVLPVIDLGQKSAWQPQGSALLYWSWALTGAGWVLTAAAVAGLTGILKRD
jgi:hypothetical protein